MKAGAEPTSCRDSCLKSTLRKHEQSQKPVQHTDTPDTDSTDLNT